MFANNLIIREWLNGSLLPLALNLTFIIGVFLWQSVQYAKAHKTRWRSLPGVQTAMALFFVFFAESVRAGFVWMILRTMNDGYKVTVLFEVTANIALAIGALVLVASVLRCTFIFTPPSYQKYYWAFSLATTAVFLVASHMFPEYPSIIHYGNLGD